jgi:hypothetical protein
MANAKAPGLREDANSADLSKGQELFTACEGLQLSSFSAGESDRNFLLKGDHELKVKNRKEYRSRQDQVGERAFTVRLDGSPITVFPNGEIALPGWVMLNKNMPAEYATVAANALKAVQEAKKHQEEVVATKQRETRAGLDTFMQ